MWLAALALSMGCDKFPGLGDEGDDQTGKSTGERSTATATGTGTSKTGAPSCDEFERVMNCMKAKAPPAQQPVIEQSTKQVLDRVKSLPPALAEQTCKQGLDQQRTVIAKVGCAGRGDQVATPGGTASAAAADAGTYPTTGLKTIADNCGKPFVILSTAPKSKGTTCHWPWARQALYAHPQFKVITDKPTAVHQVSFEVLETKQALLLVGTCWDGGTCNRLAAMYKAVVKASRPQLFCGNLPVQGTTHPSFLIPPDGYWLPAPDDAIGKCARLAACKIASSPATPGDPGLECQRAPASFKLECAARASCAEVLACTGG